MPGARIASDMGQLEWALLITLSLLWGGTFFFAEVALQELPPLTLVFARVALAALALLLAVYTTGQRMPVSLALWGAFFVMGALNNLIPFTLIFWGQTRITGGLAAILNATTPLFAVVLAHVLTRDEKMTRNRVGGVLLGAAGVVLMIGPEVLRELGLQLLAQVAVLGAALSYAVAGIFGRRFQGLAAARQRGGPAWRHDAHDAAGGPVARGAMACADAQLAGLGCDPRARAAEHGAGLPHLFPDPGHGRRHQPAPCHLPDPGQRDRSGQRACSKSGWSCSTSAAWP